MSLWVCSKWNEKPTDNEKFEVLSSGDDYYLALVDGRKYSLLKDHYRPCEPPTPPERWEDVTAECAVRENAGLARIMHQVERDKWSDVWQCNWYRLRKVQLLKGCYDEHSLPGDTTVPQWAFVVEKKVTT